MIAPADGAPVVEVEPALAAYRELVMRRLLAELPEGGPDYLAELVADYPQRPAKGLRPALCLATCAAFGGDSRRALDSAVAIELFHNAFLIHDDIQDGSERRRAAPTLQSEYGIGIALNVGNMTNLAGLQRLIETRRELGGGLAWRILQETELMMRHSLEGQAIELAWIRDNRCDLVAEDYLKMCLKKTSWYTCIYPCRIGALISGNETVAKRSLDRFGWYLGAAFQIQDDILNLVGDYELYGKEIAGDLWEGKRTLMIIDYLQRAAPDDRLRVERFLGQSRGERAQEEVRWLGDRLVESGAIQRARIFARQLADAAHQEALRGLRDLSASPDREFLLALPSYVVERDR